MSIVFYDIGFKPVECTILERVNRFTVKALINGVVKNVHLTNTGRLREYLVNGKRGFCHRINGSKLEYRLFAVEDNGLAAVVDTVLQQKVFEYLVANHQIPWLRDCRIVKRNPRLSGEVIDYLLVCGDEYLYTELKSAVLRFNGVYAGYPDCPTIRGRRQIKALINHVKQGGRALIVFIAGLPGVEAFKPYSEGDPVVAELIREASLNGVVVKAIGLYYDPVNNKVVVYNTDLAVNLDP